MLGASPEGHDASARGGGGGGGTSKMGTSSRSPEERAHLLQSFEPAPSTPSPTQWGRNLPTTIDEWRIPTGPAEQSRDNTARCGAGSLCATRHRPDVSPSPFVQARACPGNGVGVDPLVLEHCFCGGVEKRRKPRSGLCSVGAGAGGDPLPQ